LYEKGKNIPVLNWAPGQKDVCGRGGTAPRILNLGARWRWVVSFRILVNVYFSSNWVYFNNY